MRQPLVSGVLSILCAMLFGIGAATAGPTIDLNQPGAFETLQRSNSVPFEKIRKILAGLHRRRSPGAEGARAA
jgi:hypothetical protein